MLLLANFLPILVSIMISVAFYSLIERKILSYIQSRKGPNKISLLGLIQPISDAIKLFNKNLIIPEKSNNLISSISPVMLIFIPMMIISLVPFHFTTIADSFHSILMFFILSSMSVYFIMLIGWSSNSKYSFMGAIRSIAQMISYEVSFFLIIFYLTILSKSFNFQSISLIQNPMPYILGNSALFLLWMLSCLAEANRTPFDFSEGESELVSGFNVEYSSGLFTFIFLAEYMNMLILSMISCIFFLGPLMNFLNLNFLIFLSIFLIWIRGTVPRIRYDILMSFSWKIILPLILFISPFSFLFSFFYY